jgi:hypothetical protein
MIKSTLALSFRPRSSKSASSVCATSAFSVAPSQKPNVRFWPRVSRPSATTKAVPPRCTVSIKTANGAMSSKRRSRKSLSFCPVASTSRSDTALGETPNAVAAFTTVSRYRRAESPATH